MASRKDQVDAIFRRLARGELSPPTTLEQSGWEMSLPSGRTVARSTLQAEARPLIALGADAVPALLSWAANDDLALRYVAAYALEQITGETPYVPHFDRTDAEAHRRKALDVWRRWYEAR